MMPIPLFKPGDLLFLEAPTIDLFLPVAIKTENGFEALHEVRNRFPALWFSIPHFVYLPQNKTFSALVLEYEKPMPVILNSALLYEHRLFVMISFEGEPQYIRIQEKAGYVKSYSSTKVA